MQTWKKPSARFTSSCASAEGSGCFYFAGHGAELDGMGYLLPVRSGVRDRWQLPYKTLSVKYVQAAMDEAGNRLNMIILDACRDIPMFAAAEKTSWGRGHRGLPSTTAGPDMLIAYATSPGQAALDGEENSRNGIYTKHLLRAMATPGLSAEDVFRTTLSGVLEETQGKQRPWSSLSVAERFEFIPSPSPAERGASRAARPAEVATDGRPERAEVRSASGAGQGARAEPLRERQESHPTPAPSALLLEQVTDTHGRDLLRNSLGMAFVCLPGGEFSMGSTTGRADEHPAHLVRIAAFCLGKYEVTQEQWLAVMGYNPSPIADPGLPVHGITWEEADAFVHQLNVRENTPRYRLPREQEWEYAARAGWSGLYGFRAADPLGAYAWYRKNAKRAAAAGRTIAGQRLGIA